MEATVGVVSLEGSGGMSPDLPSTEEGGSAAVGRGGERRAFINRQEDLINTGCCGQ